MKKLCKKTLARCWRTAGEYHTVFTEKVAKLLYDLAPGAHITVLRSSKGRFLDSHEGRRKC